MRIQTKHLPAFPSASSNSFTHGLSLARSVAPRSSLIASWPARTRIASERNPTSTAITTVHIPTGIIDMKGTVGFLAIFALASQMAVVSANPVNITVLYESLCGDSMRFIRSQLYPTYKELKEYMNVEFVPFGKASYSKEPWWISCQHGPQECLGNAVQACALSKYSDNEMQVKFVHCVMSENYPPSMGRHCARMLNYEYDGIEECARNKEGRQLLMYYGELTRQLMKRLSFVPTILFNNEYDGELQSGALRNFKATVCKKLNDPLPEKCR